MNGITKFIGYIFFGGWASLCVIFYAKAIIDFIT